MARKPQRRQRGVPIRVREKHGYMAAHGVRVPSRQRVYTARGGKAFLMVAPTMRPGWVKANRTMVDFKYRRKGLMTRLYEVAAEDACRDGNRLVSDVNRSVFSEAFWRKQKRKGRARCVQPNRNQTENVWNGPLLDYEEYLAQKYRDKLYGDPDYDRAAREMKKLKMPKPRRGSDEGNFYTYWPCFRWGFKKKMCKEPQPFDLSGWRW
jgi:hypothetical protein